MRRRKGAAVSRRVENGGWKTEGGKRRVENGGWKTEFAFDFDSRQRTERKRVWETASSSTLLDFSQGAIPRNVDTDVTASRIELMDDSAKVSAASSLF
jgi:hypothetical protein